MGRRDTPAIIHGPLLSILLALASSIAPALHGAVVKRCWGEAGVPGWRVDGPVSRSDGVSVGEENDKRYKAIKKTSLRAHRVKSTVYVRIVSK